MHHLYVPVFLPQFPNQKQIGDADSPIAHPINQILTDGLWQIAPILNLGHQSPKTVRPNSSLRRFAAVKTPCEVVVTYNLRHFSEESLKPFGITAKHPDEFLIDIYHVNAEIVVHELHEQGAPLRTPRTINQVLALFAALAVF